MPRVLLERLTKVFKGPRGTVKYAVRELSLDIREGELLVLVGPSGCGKTTTLRLIAGLDEPTEGSVSIDGSRVNNAPPQGRDIAMVFQNHSLYPHLTAFENMALGLKLRRLPGLEIDARVKQTAALLGLTPCLNRLP